MSALTTIRRYFPDVDEVVDSAKSIRVQVKERDVFHGRKKDPKHCALATACIREQIADGAIIGIGYSYLIKGRKATRFKTSTTVSREITSYDRSGKFEKGGDYLLSKVAPRNHLGAKTPGPSGKKGGGPRKHIVHRTANIRVLKRTK